MRVSPLKPQSQDSVGAWFILVIVFGLVCTWSEFGVNRPILTEVVSVKHRARLGRYMKDAVLLSIVIGSSLS